MNQYAQNSTGEKLLKGATPKQILGARKAVREEVWYVHALRQGGKKGKEAIFPFRGVQRRKVYRDKMA